MKAYFALAVLGSLASMAGAQSVSIHISGGDATSWSFVRVKPGEIAHVGDISGIHIGDVSKDELIIVRSSKGYVVTDPNTLDKMDSLMKSNVAEVMQYQKERAVARKIKIEMRSESFSQRQIEREIERNKDASRTGELNARLKEAQEKMAHLQKESDEEAEKVSSAHKTLTAAREERLKNVEHTIDEAFKKGLAQPLR